MMTTTTATTTVTATVATAVKRGGISAVVVAVLVLLPLSRGMTVFAEQPGEPAEAETDWRNQVVEQLDTTEPLDVVMAQLARRFGFSVIVSRRVPPEAVRVTFERVSVLTAIDAICLANGCEAVVAPTARIVFVMPRQADSAIAMRTHMWTIPSDAGDMAALADQVRRIGSASAVVAFDRPSRVLFVRDVPARMAHISAYLAAISDHMHATKR